MYRARSVPTGPTRIEAHAPPVPSRRNLAPALPNRPTTPEEIAKFEQRVGWKLDPDLRAFYLRRD
jgi:hypothetical protein